MSINVLLIFYLRLILTNIRLFNYGFDFSCSCRYSTSSWTHNFSGGVPLHFSTGNYVPSSNNDMHKLGENKGTYINHKHFDISVWYSRTCNWYRNNNLRNYNYSQQRSLIKTKITTLLTLIVKMRFCL